MSGSTSFSGDPQQVEQYRCVGGAEPVCAMRQYKHLTAANARGGGSAVRSQPGNPTLCSDRQYTCSTTLPHHPQLAQASVTCHITSTICHSLTSHGGVISTTRLIYQLELTQWKPRAHNRVTINQLTGSRPAATRQSTCARGAAAGAGSWLIVQVIDQIVS